MLLLPLTLALLACAPGDSVVPPRGEQQDTATGRKVDGNYVVGWVNERDVVQYETGTDATVTLSADRIHFQSQCIYQDWAYTREGEAIDTGPWDYGDDLVGMCARGLSPDETAIIAAIDGADTLRFVPGGLWISGDAGTVQLRFQPSKSDLAARAVDLSGEWRVAGIDGEPIDADYGIALSADWYGIWWEPGCAGQGVQYTIDGSRFAVIPPTGEPGPACDIGYPPELEAIWSALAAADSIARTPENGVRISGDGRSVLLFAQ